MEWILWRELTDVPSLFSLRASAQREKVRRGGRISEYNPARRVEFRAMFQGGSDL